jgi:hypothetical protein
MRIPGDKVRGYIISVAIFVVSFFAAEMLPSPALIAFAVLLVLVILGYIGWNKGWLRRR